MKKILVLLILSCVLFLGLKKNDVRTVNLGKDCRVDYVLSADGKKVSGIKILNGKSLIQVSYSDEGDDYSLSVENNGNVSCRMNASSERLYAYSIEDKKNGFESVGNVYDGGDTSFVIRTSCYEEKTNTFVNVENPARVEKQITFDEKESYLLKLSSDGKHETEYTDDLYETLHGTKNE